MNRSCLLGAGIVFLVSVLADAAQGGRLADLGSPVPSVRAAAALSCARADAVDAVSAVEAAFLRETEERARRAEARCLVHLEAPSSLAALFRHPELFDSRLAILDPLAEAPGAEIFLLPGLADPHAAVRAFCLRHLAFPEDPERVERAVLDSIGRETDTEALREALGTAGWVGGRRTVDFLLGALWDPRTAAVAARSLARIAGRLEPPEVLLAPIAKLLSDAIGSGAAPDAIRAEILYLAAQDRRLAPLLAPAAGALLLRAAVPGRRAPWGASAAAPGAASAGLLAAASYLLRIDGYEGHEARIRAGALLLDTGGMADGAGMLLAVDGAAAAALMVSRLDDPRCFRAALDGLIRLGEAARPAFAAAVETRSAAQSTAYALWQVGTATRAMAASGTALEAASGTALEAASGTAP